VPHHNYFDCKSGEDLMQENLPHQASQRESERQLGKPTKILKSPWELLRDLK
jgi:hypothetical protein